jgi:hypothetical protein
MVRSNFLTCSLAQLLAAWVTIVCRESGKIRVRVYILSHPAFSDAYCIMQLIERTMAVLPDRIPMKILMIPLQIPAQLYPSRHLPALISVLPTLSRPTVVVLDAFDRFALHPAVAIRFSGRMWRTAAPTELDI